jgi:RNA polymerase sigma-70 factor (ECF subfamily)
MPAESSTAHPPAVGAGSGAFESTHWTVVLEAAQQDSAAGAAALASLCTMYWYPIYAFIRRSGRSAEDAEDLTQSFFERLLEKNWLNSVTREGGRFRSLLLKAVKHFLINAHDRSQTLKRGGGRALLSTDARDPEMRYQLEAVDTLTPDRFFEQKLACQTLERALARLRQEYVRAEKGALFEELKPFLSGVARPVSQADLAQRHGITVSAVSVAVHRLRKRYGELLRQEVARTVNDPQEVDDELRHLLTVLGPLLG